MKKSTFWVIVIIIAVGVFYFTRPTDTPEQTEPAVSSETSMEESTSEEDEMTPDASESDEMAVMADSDIECIELSAKAAGDRKVEFNWTVSEDCESEFGYKIVYEKEVNPTDPSSWSWWRGPAHRELVWESLPTGPGHFRICPMVADDTCGETYSNDVELEVE